MISSKDKETLKKHLIDAIDIVENESCGLDTFFNESTEAKEDNLSSFQSTKVEDTGQEAEFIECIENIENLQSELDIFSKSLHTLMENRIGAHKQPVDGEVEKPNAENNVTRPSHGGTEPVKQLSPDNTDGKSGDRDYEDMEDHSRETEFERQNDEEKKMYLCAEEYNKAKEEADLYKRKPIPDPNSPEEIPKEIQIDEPQYWDFSEDDWRKRVAFEKRMVNGECKKFGR
ncbi:unnamed protein product [Hymenolepis diminuta]|uniref:Uncharacterized protein n=1 Tax=Hymenolepis diminuta TaxID=6216 RepID=A0A564YST5_HYMDI|nr:unnamed protein product [Hymenolepis diminuta]